MGLAPTEHIDHWSNTETIDPHVYSGSAVKSPVHKLDLHYACYIFLHFPKYVKLPFNITKKQLSEIYVKFPELKPCIYNICIHKNKKNPTMYTYRYIRCEKDKEDMQKMSLCSDSNPE